MRVELPGRAATIDLMPPDKKRPNSKSGVHKVKRVGVNVPETWHALMRQLAGKRKQPVLWYLIDLVIADAEASGVGTPPPPWEEK